MAQLKHKDSLSELTDTQREIVRLKANNPEHSASEIDKTVGTNQYAYSVIDTFDHLIEEIREDDVAEFEAACEEPGADTSADGEIEYENENFSFTGEPFDATYQHLSERDHETAEPPEEVAATVDVELELTRMDVKDLLNGDFEGVKGDVINAVLNEVFDNE